MKKNRKKEKRTNRQIEASIQKWRNQRTDREYQKTNQLEVSLRTALAIAAGNIPEFEDTDATDLIIFKKFR